MLTPLHCFDGDPSLPLQFSVLPVFSYLFPLSFKPHYLGGEAMGCIRLIVSSDLGGRCLKSNSAEASFSVSQGIALVQFTELSKIHKECGAVNVFQSYDF